MSETQPNLQSIAGESACLQQMAPVRRVQSITASGSNVLVTLKAPSSIVNPTDTGGFIAYKLADDNDAYIVEYFEAGQEKMRMVQIGDGTTGIGGSGAGTTVTASMVCES